MDEFEAALPQRVTSSAPQLRKAALVTVAADPMGATVI